MDSRPVCMRASAERRVPNARAVWARGPCRPPSTRHRHERAPTVGALDVHRYTSQDRALPSWLFRTTTTQPRLRGQCRTCRLLCQCVCVRRYLGPLLTTPRSQGQFLRTKLSAFKILHRTSSHAKKRCFPSARARQIALLLKVQ
jgi:hypothetical protein